MVYIPTPFSYVNINDTWYDESLLFFFCFFLFVFRVPCVVCFFCWFVRLLLFCVCIYVFISWQESLGSKFKRQLHSLMAAIQRTEVQYVRCIKPNANKSKDELNCNMVVEQLRCAGVVEVRAWTYVSLPTNRIFKYIRVWCSRSSVC